MRQKRDAAEQPVIHRKMWLQIFDFEQVHEIGPVEINLNGDGRRGVFVFKRNETNSTCQSPMNLATSASNALTCWIEESYRTEAATLIEPALMVGWIKRFVVQFKQNRVPCGARTIVGAKPILTSSASDVATRTSAGKADSDAWIVSISSIKLVRDPYK